MAKASEKAQLNDEAWRALKTARLHLPKEVADDLEAKVAAALEAEARPEVVAEGYVNKRVLAIYNDHKERGVLRGMAVMPEPEDDSIPVRILAPGREGT